MRCVAICNGCGATGGVYLYIQGVVLQEVCSYIYRVWCYMRCVAICNGCGATGGV
jgi:hypothetical protein